MYDNCDENMIIMVRYLTRMDIDEISYNYDNCDEIFYNYETVVRSLTSMITEMGSLFNCQNILRVCLQTFVVLTVIPYKSLL